ncbi:hypothetical protein DY000_02029210 [Brassica cretica]|uniref:Uncharacterized protein n=1 Tax=Brassica cretica TaxID=69181 RepID=A0ABQ7DWV3_BRACR|nr:hypothetical protein DY000_02029210 [Brassica cretica]
MMPSFGRDNRRLPPLAQTTVTVYTLLTRSPGNRTLGRRQPITPPATATPEVRDEHLRNLANATRAAKLWRGPPQSRENRRETTRSNVVTEGRRERSSRASMTVESQQI